MNDDVKELVRMLNQPHRVPNMLALMRACEKAATLIQAQAAEIEALKAAKKPAARKSKAADEG